MFTMAGAALVCWRAVRKRVSHYVRKDAAINSPDTSRGKRTAENPTALEPSTANSNRSRLERACQEDGRHCRRPFHRPGAGVLRWTMLRVWRLSRETLWT